MRGIANQTHKFQISDLNIIAAKRKHPGQYDAIPLGQKTTISALKG